ncbi:hypothetical protein EMCRGX_G007511 [Ephydatia muelleri]
MEDANQEMTEECAIPKFGSPPKVEFPEIIKACFVTVVDKFNDLFVTTPGTTSLASHRITTAGTPVRVPSRRIPVHFREEVEVQIQQLLEKGIITESNSPWLAPAVYVTYLGHLFTGSGVTPDREKVKVVEEWPIPQNATEVRQFLGLASWRSSRAFKTLKCKLIGAPILVYPRVDKEASKFQLQTDASALGLGAVLEQGGHVIAYASRILTKAEANYSVIQRECLAVVYGIRQFRHYLLGRSFQLWTDPQTTAMAIRTKNGGNVVSLGPSITGVQLTVEYRKGSHNDNADALSRRREIVGRASHLAATRSTTGVLAEQIRIAQQQDDIIQQVYQASVKQPSSNRDNLLLADTISYGHNSNSEKVWSTEHTSLDPHQKLLHATGGHQGWQKTLHKLRREAYWVNMAQDADQHCRECNICQRTKPTAPKRATLINIPVGRPWQMVAVDILEVPVSSNSNRYILVVQDYVTKWADARPIPDQTAVRITRELVHIFAGYGIPEIIHSDQGRNFESTIFQQTMAAFGVKKSRTTAYHPQGDGMVERFNRTLPSSLCGPTE